jgi:hypothetical protein
MEMNLDPQCYEEDEYCFHCGEWVADGEMYYHGVTPLCVKCHDKSHAETTEATNQ